MRLLDQPPRFLARIRRYPPPPKKHPGSRCARISSLFSSYPPISVPKKQCVGHVSPAGHTLILEDRFNSLRDCVFAGVEAPPHCYPGGWRKSFARGRGEGGVFASTPSSYGGLGPRRSPTRDSAATAPA